MMIQSQFCKYLDVLLNLLHLMLTQSAKHESMSFRRAKASVWTSMCMDTLFAQGLWIVYGAFVFPVVCSVTDAIVNICNILSCLSSGVSGAL